MQRQRKKEFLPAIAQDKVQWDQVFTEPNAGSDEANIQLRAAEDGDDFVFNGQKMFVSEAYDADYLYMLARTADTTPKYRGLTLFLIPADTPGISYGMLPVMSTQMKKEIFIKHGPMLGYLHQDFHYLLL